MIGCSHNIDRVILHGPSDYSYYYREIIYQPGDHVVLRCPRGCEDVVWSVRDRGKERDKDMGADTNFSCPKKSDNSENPSESDS